MIYNLAEALLDEGDTIAFAVPYWTSYLDIADIVGAKIDLLPCPPEQHYKLTPAQLDAALAKKPKVFLFNNPNNPTGMVCTKAEIDALSPTSSRSIRTPGSSPTTSTTAWCSTASATTTSCTAGRNCATG